MVVLLTGASSADILLEAVSAADVKVSLTAEFVTGVIEASVSLVSGIE